jgi:hypothetical protein
MTWTGEAGGAISHVQVTLPEASGWSDVQLEVWPARREGIVIEPDPTAGRATLASIVSVIDFALLSPSQSDWWVTVSAVGTDGQRHTIAADLRLGRPPHFHGSLLNWLIQAP